MVIKMSNDKQPVLHMHASEIDHGCTLSDHYLSENILRELVGDDVVKQVDDVVDGYDADQTVRVLRPVHRNGTSSMVKCYNVAWLDILLREFVEPTQFYDFTVVAAPSAETPAMTSLLDAPNCVLTVSLPEGERTLYYRILPKFGFMAASANVFFSLVLSELFHRSFVQQGIKAGFDLTANAKAITSAARALTHWRKPSNRVVMKSDLCLQRGRLDVLLQNGIRVQSINKREQEIAARIDEANPLILGELWLGELFTPIRISSTVLDDGVLAAFLTDRESIAMDLQRILRDLMRPSGLTAVYVKLDKVDGSVLDSSLDLDFSKQPCPEHVTEFMWACSRTEGEGALVSITDKYRPEDTPVHLPDIRNEQQIATTPDTVEAFNLGVSNGIVSLLDHLHENGYTIVDREGMAIQTEQSLGQAYCNWLKAPTYPK